MNIFFLHYNTKKCARYHCDKHVIKMILETAQLLCSAIWLCGGQAPYKLTHKNHPSAIWTRTSKNNWNWLYSLGIELCAEYTFRYGKIHKTESIIRSLTVPESLENIDFTPPTPAMPEEYKPDEITNDSVVACYRAYYLNEKTKLLTWKNRKIPGWVAKKEFLYSPLARSLKEYFAPLVQS